MLIISVELSTESNLLTLITGYTETTTMASVSSDSSGQLVTCVVLYQVPETILSAVKKLIKHFFVHSV